MKAKSYAHMDPRVLSGSKNLLRVVKLGLCRKRAKPHWPTCATGYALIRMSSSKRSSVGPVLPWCNRQELLPARTVDPNPSESRCRPPVFDLRLIAYFRKDSNRRYSHEQCSLHGVALVRELTTLS